MCPRKRSPNVLERTVFEDLEKSNGSRVILNDRVEQTREGRISEFARTQRLGSQPSVENGRNIFLSVVKSNRILDSGAKARY